MAFSKKTYTSGQTAITADNLNAIQDELIRVGGAGTAPVADYIVEQGTSGIWTYRKWNSGLGEYWGKEQGFTLDDGWHKSPAAPFTLVNTDKAVATVTNWYGTDDNRAARPNIITCGGIYDDGSISIYDRNYNDTLGTGYRAYCYDVKARWK